MAPSDHGKVGPSPEPFDVCGPLPSGTVLLEASAGTGKTFTIAALTARLVAEGHCRLDELLLITFGRAATRELRERVRERLVGTAAALADPEAARGSADSVVALLAQATEDEVRRRQRRLRRAVASFDAATIDTTHAFCLRVLRDLGTAADMEPGLTFVDPFQELLDDLVDDSYLSRFALAEQRPLLEHAEARGLARAVLADPHASLMPPLESVDPDELPGMRRAFVEQLRTSLRDRKRRNRLYGYDDLPDRLLAALRDEVTGPLARQRLQQRYRYVLVDEFQDTDPVQWEILHRAFYGTVNLVLIGDPKQAIYAFRGGDVEAYLAAARVVAEAAAAGRGRHATLARNWRSDEPLVRAVSAVLGGAALGDPQIVVRPVDAEHGRRLLPAVPPLQLRVVPRTVAGSDGVKLASVGAVREVVARDVASQVVRTLREAAADSLCPADIAVLTRTQGQSELVRDALTALGVPAVLTSVRSVFDSEGAALWLDLLRVLEQPHRLGPLRALALTDVVGWDSATLDAADDDVVEGLRRRVLSWRDTLAALGVAALMEALTADGVDVRLLGHSDGERRLTDFRHVGQTLHEAQVSEALGAAALAEWLQRHIEAAAGDQSEERSRRLETDADAVQIITVHVSKGLEFPVVFVPFGWDRYDNRASEAPLLHLEGRRVREVGGKEGPGHAALAAACKQEEGDEELRLLYVALTRAQHRVVAWWAPTARNTASSPLHRLLFGGFAPGEIPPAAPPVPRDAEERLRSFAGQAGQHEGVPLLEAVIVEEDDEPPRWDADTAALGEGDLRVADFGRSLDYGWRRLSYTALTRAAHDAHSAHLPPRGRDAADEEVSTRGLGGAGSAEVRRDELGVGSEPEVSEVTDEPSPRGAVRAPDASDEAAQDRRHDGWREVLSPMRDLPSGAAFGVVVHEVFEHVDTGAPDLPAALVDACRSALRSRPVSGVDDVALATALLPALKTPLGPVGHARSLAQIGPQDRLAELDFELPLAGGDQPTDRLTLAAVADVLRAHVPESDPLHAYVDALEQDGLLGQVLRGYLTGSIDAVLRLRGDDGEPSYVVVDYKTNWLGGFGSEAAPLSAWDYRPAAMTQAMVDAHYPLQALLYSVALHRYLRWRQPGYDPQRHLGGVLYLFLRGMSGPSSPVGDDGTVPGVFSWRPTAALVTALSAALAGAGA